MNTHHARQTGAGRAVSTRRTLHPLTVLPWLAAIGCWAFLALAGARVLGIET